MMTLPVAPAQPLSVSVLVVEDDPFQQLVIRSLLEGLGQDMRIFINLTLTPTSVQALEACQEASFDLVLLDYLLPGGNGGTALPAIRSGVGDSAVVVMMSSQQQEDLMLQCLKKGADTYRLKPVSLHTVKELVENVVARRMVCNVPTRSIVLPQPTKTTVFLDMLHGDQPAGHQPVNEVQADACEPTLSTSATSRKQGALTEQDALAEQGTSAGSGLPASHDLHDARCSLANLGLSPLNQSPRALPLAKNGPSSDAAVAEPLPAAPTEAQPSAAYGLSVAQIIGTAIAFGTPLYNRGAIAECYEVCCLHALLVLLCPPRAWQARHDLQRSPMVSHDLI